MSQSPSPLHWRVQLYLTLLAGGLSILLLHWLILINLGAAPGAALTDSLASNLLLLGMCLLTAFATRYYSPARMSMLSFIPSAALLGACWVLLYLALLPMIHEEHFADIYVKRGLLPRFFMAFLVAWLFLLHNRGAAMMRRNEEHESRRSEVENLAVTAELNSIRQQLQPHFLFNTLNSVNALIETDPVKARVMLNQLSDFLRTSLKKDRPHQITVSEEMEHLGLYLELEKIRFGTRLQPIIELGDDCLDALLPSMLVQPLVENAIKFGLYDVLDTVSITIKGCMKGPFLELTVENPFDPETGSGLKGTGFGLSSVQRRMYLLFGRHDLVTTSAENGIFRVMIKIPQLT